MRCRGHVAERHESALAAEDPKTFSLRAAEKRAEPATERARPLVHRSLLDLVARQALVEQQQSFVTELDFHGATLARSGERLNSRCEPDDELVRKLVARHDTRPD